MGCGVEVLMFASVSHDAQNKDENVMEQYGYGKGELRGDTEKQHQSNVAALL